MKWEKHDAVVGTIRAMKEKVTFEIVTPYSLPEIACRCNLKLSKIVHGKENGHNHRNDHNGTISSESSVNSRYSASSGSTESLNERMSTDLRSGDSKSSSESSSVSDKTAAESAPKSLHDVDLW